MERLRQAPLQTQEEATPPFQVRAPPVLSVPARSLLQQLQALREPEVSQQEVDAFMDGLSTDLPVDEPPRVRADVMLDILEDERLCELSASDGSRVGPIALEVLMELGFPYALEVTPAMLKRARVGPPLVVPSDVKGGLAVAGLNGALYVSQTLGHYMEHLSLRELRSHLVHFDPVAHAYRLDDAATGMPVFLAMLLGPALLTGMTWWLGLRSARPFFNALQWSVGLGSLALGYSGELFGLRVPVYGLLLMATGVLSLVSAWMMRPRLEPGSEPVALPSA